MHMFHRRKSYLQESKPGTSSQSQPNDDTTTCCTGRFCRRLRMDIRRLYFHIFKNPERSRRRHSKLVERVKVKQEVRKRESMQRQQSQQSQTGTAETKGL